MHKGNKGADIGSINAVPVRMATQILACRVMRKQKKGEKRAAIAAIRRSRLSNR